VRNPVTAKFAGMTFGAALRIPAPDEKVDRWHVSPLVDLSAYSLGWLWVLVPLLLLGPTRADYLLVYLLVIAATDLHRHFGLPYVYLDRHVRQRYPARFWLFPAIMLLAFALGPTLADSAWILGTSELLVLVTMLVALIVLLRRDGDPEKPARGELATVLRSAAMLGLIGSLVVVAWMGLSLIGWPAALTIALPVVTLLEIIGVFAALWNFWHVYMQKYGIMRMYNAKALAADPNLKEVPGWTDKLLLLCWLPLYFAWLGPLYREIAVDYFDDAAAVLPGFIDVLERAMPITMPITIALVVVAHALWLRAQWRAGGTLRSSAPRLWMAGGTSALAMCFFAFDPVKVYMAFAFSHAIEYCVFVWAFQRRRYQAPLEHRPLLGRMLRHPATFYVALILLFGVGFLLLKFWGRFIFPDEPRPEVLGHRTAYWLGFWGVYQSMVHFYFDGFLWKMRLPSVRANL
jgi:hypothetical protein